MLLLVFLAASRFFRDVRAAKKKRTVRGAVRSSDQYGYTLASVRNCTVLFHGVGPRSKEDRDTRTVQLVSQLSTSTWW